MFPYTQPIPPSHENQVEPGSKVVAPCRCRGTAKWMWFADMNRRRRRWVGTHALPLPFRVEPRVFHSHSSTAHTHMIDIHTYTHRDPVSTRACGTCHAVIDYGVYQQFGCASFSMACLYCTLLSFPNRRLARLSARTRHTRSFPFPETGRWCARPSPGRWTTPPLPASSSAPVCCPR